MAPIHITVGTGGIDFDGWAEKSAPVWTAERLIEHGYVVCVLQGDLKLLNITICFQSSPSFDSHAVLVSVSAGGRRDSRLPSRTIH